MNKTLAIWLLIFCTSQSSAQIKAENFDYNKKNIHSVKIVQNQRIYSTIMLEKIVLDGFDSKTPFYHYINKQQNTQKYIILLHGLGGSKNDWVYPSKPHLAWREDLTAIKDALLKQGYSIIIPDAKYHGERSYELDFRPAGELLPALSKNEHDGKTFAHLMTATVKDVRIIMDYIQSRFDTDDLSFGVVGYSMGGAIAIFLNASDNRVSSVVACVTPLNHPQKELGEFDWPVSLKQELSDVTPSNYSRQQKAPIMLLMGKKDFFYTETEVNTFFETIPNQEKALKFFDSGHVLPKEYKADVLNWITKHNNN